MVENIRNKALTFLLFAAISAHNVCAANVLADAAPSPSTSGEPKHSGRSATFIVQACLIPVLVILSGILAGLTLGYMSLDETQLRVLSVSGSPKQREYALKIEPIRRNGHLLLTTLLLGNMIVNETLPVLSENVLGGGIQAVVVSTVLIVVFSEIIPQSLCSRFGLQIGAFMATPTRFLMYFMFVIAWPIAKLLEFVLGPHHGIVYRRNELKELINMHSAMSAHGGDLQTDTVTMVGGALDFQEKTVVDAMTPIKDVFMLSIESRLDYETLARVVRSGHSRVPVYEEAKSVTGQVTKKIIGILLVKQCVLLDPEDATPLRDIPLNNVLMIPFNEPLLRTLDRFQQGNSHIAVVSRIPSVTESKVKPGSVNEEAKVGLTRRFLNRVGLGDTDTSDSSDSDNEGSASSHHHRKKHTRKKSNSSTTSSKKSQNKDKADKVPKPKPKESTPPASNWMQWNRMDALEQTMPSDAVLNDENAEEFLAGLQRAPLGIITLEDVLEELIGEEILDEFDLKGASALPASSFVPAEAQRAVDDAAKARAAKTAITPAVTKEKGDPLGVAPAATPNASTTNLRLAQGLRAMRLKASAMTGVGGAAAGTTAAAAIAKPTEALGPVVPPPTIVAPPAVQSPVAVKPAQVLSGLPPPFSAIDRSENVTPASDVGVPTAEIPMARGGSKGAKKRAFKSPIGGEGATPGLEKRNDTSTGGPAARAPAGILPLTQANTPVPPATPVPAPVAGAGGESEGVKKNDEKDDGGDQGSKDQPRKTDTEGKPKGE